MKTINTYYFNELDDSAKEVAIEKFRGEGDVYLEFFNDDCVETAKEHGFEGKIGLQYSLSYCQGDGLSFSCEWFNSQKLHEIFVEVLGMGKDKTIETIINECSFSLVGNNGHYCYANKNDLDFCFTDNVYAPNIEKVVGKVKEKLVEIYLNLCKELEKRGYDEIDYQYSDEYISTELIEREYEFLENGKLI